MDDNLDGLRRYLEKYASLAENRKKSIDTVADEFAEIRNISADLKKTLTTAEGAKEVNRKKNRYKDILPYDISRVKLDVTSFSDGADYINANFITDYNRQRCYIASQGPMPHTVNDFWKMIWHYKVKVVIMACKQIELGKPRCQRYWPLGMGGEETFGDIVINLLCETKVAPNMMLRDLVITKKNSKTRNVSQLHFMDWPDHGAPETYETILHLLKLARNKQPNDDAPLLVHCSAGCGRTGAIIAIDYARKMIEQRVKEISVFDIVKHLREQRPAMVQTKEQYEFIYEVIRELVSKELKACSEDWSPDPTYENIQFVFKDRGYSSSSSCDNVKAIDYEATPRTHSHENDLVKDGGQPTQQRKQIILPTEHAVNTSNFRRSRSQHVRHSATSSFRPPVPRKGSESSSLLPPSTTKKQAYQLPAKPGNSPSISTNYENVSNYPTSSQLDPLSPVANEEFIPKATPVGLNAYPRMTHLMNVSQVEHRHNAIKPTRSHELLTQNNSNIPQNTLLSVANDKLKKAKSADDLLSERGIIQEPLDALYTPVNKAQRDADRAINKVAASTENISERSKSNSKNGMEGVKKTQVERTVSNTSWTPSVETSETGVSALPERTPESNIILEPDVDIKPRTLVESEASFDYTPVSSVILPDQNKQQQHKRPNPSAYKNLISQTPSPDKATNRNPIVKMFGRNKNTEDNKQTFTMYTKPIEPEHQKIQNAPTSKNHTGFGFGVRLKRKPKGPRELPAKFR